MKMLDDLDDAALDALPFGVVCLGQDNRVLRMNRAESEASGIQRWRALGRDYFRDVAPAAANRPLAEHVAAFATGKTGAAQLHHVFHRRAGDDKTEIELRRERERLYLVIRR
jgi:photoactive yellow protein